MGAGYEMGDTVTEADVFACGGFGIPFFETLHGKFGKTAKFTMMGAPHVSISDPSVVEEYHTKFNIRPATLFPMLNYLGKENLLFRQNTQEIRAIRERYNRITRSDAAHRLVHETTIKCVEAAVKAWEGRPVDTKAELSPVIYSIMGNMMFGREWSETEWGLKVKEMHLYCIKNVDKWAYLPPEKCEGEPEYKVYVQTVANLREACGKILDIKKKRGIDSSGRMDAFTLLLQEKKDDGTPFFDREFSITTMIGFLNGAYDTTLCTLNWALFHLAKFPTFQEKLREEIISTLGASDPFTIQQARDLKYLNAYILESQRHHMTTPFNMRCAQEDVTISGVRVPAGMPVFFIYALVGRDEKVFGKGASDPHGFDPDRFLQDAQCAETLTPFGGSTRKCVGSLLAQIELKAAIIAILRNSRVSLAQETKLPMATELEAGVLVPKNPVKVLFTPIPQPSVNFLAPMLIAGVAAAALAYFRYSGK